MRADWHRYNLKRRVAQLPSILSEMFAEKVLEQQKQSEETVGDEDEYGFHVAHRKKSGKGERQITKKELKQMSREQARRTGRLLDSDIVVVRSHSPATSVASESEFSEFSLGDSVHLSEVDSVVETASDFNYSDGTHSDWSWHSEESEGEESEEDDVELPQALPNHYCYYCGKNNGELEQNIRHMSNRHGLYIPERTYLTDLEGLLTFINEVITVDYECLTCGFQGRSLESIRQHMQSKGHCRIPYESKEEKQVISEFYDFSLAEEPTKKASKKKVSFGTAQDDSDYEIVDVEDFSLEHVAGETSELTLPSGCKVGHRSMVRYNKPNLPVQRELPEATRTVALVDRRFAPGLGQVQITRQEKEMRRLEIKAKNIHQRREKTRRANYQPHFRDEILGT